VLGRPDVDVRAGKTGIHFEGGRTVFATLLRLPQAVRKSRWSLLGARSNAGRFMEIAEPVQAWVCGKRRQSSAASRRRTQKKPQGTQQ